MLISRGARGVHTLNPRQLCNVVFALRMERLQSQDEVDEFLWELREPFDPMEQAEAVTASMTRQMQAGQ